MTIARHLDPSPSTLRYHSASSVSNPPILPRRHAIRASLLFQADARGAGKASAASPPPTRPADSEQKQKCNALVRKNVRHLDRDIQNLRGLEQKTKGFILQASRRSQRNPSQAK